MVTFQLTLVNDMTVPLSQTNGQARRASEFSIVPSCRKARFSQQRKRVRTQKHQQILVCCRMNVCISHKFDGKVPEATFYSEKGEHYKVKFHSLQRSDYCSYFVLNRLVSNIAQNFPRVYKLRRAGHCLLPSFGA